MFKYTTHTLAYLRLTILVKTVSPLRSSTAKKHHALQTLLSPVVSIVVSVGPAGKAITWASFAGIIFGSFLGNS